MAICVLGLSFVTFAQEAESSAAQCDAASQLPPYIQIVADGNVVSPVYTPDSVFNRIAGRTIFRVNRTELVPDDPFINELVDSVLPMIRRSGWKLVCIDLRGAASPEGPYLNNVRLSKGRARTMANFLRSHLHDVQVNDIETHTVAEDYAYLLYLLERDGDSAAPLLRRIIEKRGADNYAAIKSDLRALYGGKYWFRLLRDYFPKVRAARIVMYFERVATMQPIPLQDDALETSRRQIVNFPPEVPTLEPVPFAPPMILERIGEAERQHAFAVSTNALYDLFYMPNFGFAPMWNVGVEWFPRNSAWTLRGQFTSPYYHRWSKNKFFQIRDYHLEARRYFRPGPYHTGWYIGAYANANKYGIGLSAKKGWQGEGYGGALKIGYVLRLARRWRLEFHAAAGYYVTRFDPYVYGNPITGEVDDDYYYDWVHGPDTFHRRNHRFHWLGPTEVGITLSFDLLYYLNRRNGVSFRGKEAVR